MNSGLVECGQFTPDTLAIPPRVWINPRAIIMIVECTFNIQPGEAPAGNNGQIVSAALPIPIPVYQVFLQGGAHAMLHRKQSIDKLINPDAESWEQAER